MRTAWSNCPSAVLGLSRVGAAILVAIALLRLVAGATVVATGIVAVAAAMVVASVGVERRVQRADPAPRAVQKIPILELGTPPDRLGASATDGMTP